MTNPSSGDEEPLRSTEAFAAFAAEMREQIAAEARAQRRAAERDRLQGHQAETIELIDAARAVHAGEVTARLEAVLADACRRLAELDEWRAAPQALPQTPAALPLIAAPPRERPLADIAQEAIACREELRAQLLTARGENGQWDEASRLRLCAFACAERQLRAQAGDVGVWEDVSALDGLRDEIKTVREHARNNGDDASPPFSNGDVGALSSAQWHGLGRDYDALAEGWEACAWLEQNAALLPFGNKQALLNAVAGIQGISYRAHYRLGTREPLQSRLHDYVHDLARNTNVYVELLRAGAAYAELAEAAQSLARALADAHEIVAGHNEAEAKKQRQTEAIAHLARVVEQPGFGRDANAREQDGDTLQEALRGCLAQGIAPSHKEARALILPWTGLVHDPEFARFVQEAEKERKRIGDTSESEEDDAADATPIDPYKLQCVLALTRGKKGLLLGGTPRTTVLPRIKQTLEMTELEWPTTSDGDKRWVSALRKADFPILMTGYASHKLSDKCKEIAREENKPLVLVPRGFGISRIVREIFDQATPRGRETLPAA